MSTSIGALQQLVDNVSNSVVKNAAQRLLDIASTAGDPDFVSSVGAMLSLSARGNGVPIFYSGMGPLGVQNRSHALDVRDKVLGGNGYIWENTPLGQYIETRVTTNLESQRYLPPGARSAAIDYLSAKMAAEATVLRSPAWRVSCPATTRRGSRRSCPRRGPAPASPRSTTFQSIWLLSPILLPRRK